MPKSKRTRTGCLCCRRRHKKCDEMKPSCKFCLSKGLKCEWPVKGSVFVNYQSQSSQQSQPIGSTTSTIAPSPSLTNASSSISDSESISISSNSRKSSFDFNYSISNSSANTTSNSNPNSVSLPPIKHYHMVIPRNVSPTSSQSNTRSTSSQSAESRTNTQHKIFKPKPISPPIFKNFTFNNINSFDQNLTPINFNQSKRLSVDSLLN